MHVAVAGNVTIAIAVVASSYYIELDCGYIYHSYNYSCHGTLVLNIY